VSDIPTSDWLGQERVLVIGHRGASALAPENTLASFGLCVDLGADGVELDVQLSADGWPVVIHDHTVTRTTGGQGAVGEMTVAELRRLEIGQGQRIPTLDDVFQAFGPALLYNVEIKDWGWRDRGTEASVADRIEAYHLQHRVLVSSFNPLSLRRARRHLGPAVPLALIRQPGWQRYLYWLTRGQADHPHSSLVNRGYMAQARRNQMRVHVWTVDDPAEAQRLADLGVHALITNAPHTIRPVLEGP
jgi:glycerophosphoryl diester phosphodiesterase